VRVNGRGPRGRGAFSAFKSVESERTSIPVPATAHKIAPGNTARPGGEMLHLATLRSQQPYPSYPLIPVTRSTVSPTPTPRSRAMRLIPSPSGLACRTAAASFGRPSCAGADDLAGLVLKFEQLARQDDRPRRRRQVTRNVSLDFSARATRMTVNLRFHRKKTPPSPREAHRNRWLDIGMPACACDSTKAPLQSLDNVRSEPRSAGRKPP
jgi:hypothetical protein